MENDFLLEQTCTNLLNKFKEKIVNRNIGLWCFKYIIAKRCLKTWYFIPIDDKKINDDIKKLINKLEISEGVGSIGYMMLKKEGIPIKDTFADPRATVSQTDEFIGQKSALCYPIINNNRIIVGLDFFSPIENFFDHEHLISLQSIITKYEETFINLYNYSNKQDILDLYEKDIKIPNRLKLETIEDYIKKSYKAFLNRFHDIASKIARISIVEFLKENDKNNFQVEGVFFDSNEIKNVLSQELLLCNYKFFWANDCPIIKGTLSRSDCECCQKPLESLLKNFDISKNSELKPEHCDGGFYKILIFPYKENIKFDLFFKWIKNVLYSYEDIFNLLDPKKLKIELDKLKNELENKIFLTNDDTQKTFIKSNIKSALIFLKLKNTYRWIMDIRSIDEIATITKNPIYLNKSTILSLVSSLEDPNILEEYPPNIKSHDDVEDIKVTELCHTIKLKKGENVLIKWKKKPEWHDLFYTFINESWIGEISSKETSSDEIKESIIKYLNLKCSVVNIDQFTKLHIYTPFPADIQTIWKEFEKYITNLYSFYEISILKEKTILSSEKSAVAAIMSRNMSHNIGSHVLANYAQEDYNGKTINKLNINKIFNSYIQQRMDFIAGLTSGWYGLHEEIWFFKDLIYGFLKNIPLLDLIISSHGFTKENMNFKIKINGSECELKIENTKNDQFEIYNSSTDGYDFLVGIPRGIIGNHAFYIILENIIRNSAKYGLDRAQKKLEVNISCKLNKENGVYDLEIYDNLSLSGNHERNIVQEIQDKINEEIINPQTGSPNYENMGITEIKENARMLIDPYKKNNDLLYTTNQAICVDKTQKNSKSYLTYKFRLKIPNIMTIITEKKYNPPLSEGMYCKENPEIILSAKENSFLFLISKVKRESIEHNSEKWYLPYRFLEKKEEDLPENSDIEDWKEFFLDKYCDWINKFFLIKEKYNLVISFERSKEAERWKKIELVNFDNLDVHVVWTEKNGIFKKLIKSTNYSNDNDENFLNTIKEGKLNNFILYDNHKNFRGFLENNKITPLYCHDIGRGNEKLFGLLDFPIEDPFLQKYIFLNLWETSLTKILIIDERIAESYIDTRMKNISTFNVNEDEEYLKLVPIFYIRINNKIYFISERLKKAYENTDNTRCQLAGLELDSKNWRIIRGKNYDDNKYHICVLHQGVVDESIIPNVLDENWFYGYSGLCEHFVVTSGRGKFIKYIPEDLPFIEFSVLKENLLDDKSKVHLLKAISMTKGGREE